MAPKARWIAKAMHGNMIRCIGSLSSTATVEFTVNVGEHERKVIQKSILALHGSRGAKLHATFDGGNFWSHLQTINPSQTRPYPIRQPDHGHRKDPNHKVRLYASFPSLTKEGSGHLTNTSQLAADTNQNGADTNERPKGRPK